MHHRKQGSEEIPQNENAEAVDTKAHWKSRRRLWWLSQTSAGILKDCYVSRFGGREGVLADKCGVIDTKGVLALAKELSGGKRASPNSLWTEQL